MAQAQVFVGQQRKDARPVASQQEELEDLELSRAVQELEKAVAQENEVAPPQRIPIIPRRRRQPAKSRTSSSGRTRLAPAASAQSDYPTQAVSAAAPSLPRSQAESVQFLEAPPQFLQLRVEELLFYNLLFDLVIAPALEQFGSTSVGAPPNPSTQVSLVAAEVESASVAAAPTNLNSPALVSRIRIVSIKTALLRTFLNLTATSALAPDETVHDHLHSCFIRSAASMGISLL